MSSFRFYIRGPENGEIRLANIRKLAKELFSGNKSAMINFALNKTFGLDDETGERKPNAPVYEIRPASLILVAEDIQKPKPAQKTKKQKY